MNSLRFLVDVNVLVQEIVNRFGDQLPGRFCVYRHGRLRIRP
jgi:hypothetical protein